ncbi:DUF6705 family protein [Hymenobacter metallilatus]|uniref:DUF6705 domain-containing protein n=1 Tax=Hymenobacter metallilatus TaxID=2493666 RepID=A0A3R9ULM3_9BACT|nr:DUF6705 family protein [Hymenobacter metallilatus]RSK34687.1 hypothetical protein EI290_08705 [Hymenobacter metallilatus]
MMSRTLYILFVLLLCGQVSHAQQKKSPSKPSGSKPQLSTAHRPLPGEENPQPPAPAYQAEAFLGTWEWRSGTDVFRMTLRRDRFHRLPNGEQRHVLLSVHSFSRNGVLLENPDTDASVQKHGHSMFGIPYADWEINMMLADLTKKKSGKAFLTIDPATPNQMEFSLKGMEAVRIAVPGMPPLPPQGFTVPTRMTLTRVQ